MATLYEPFQNRLPGAPPIPQGFRPPAAPSQRAPMMMNTGTSAGAGFNSKPFGMQGGSPMGGQLNRAYTPNGPSDSQYVPPAHVAAATQGIPSATGRMFQPPEAQFNADKSNIGLAYNPGTVELFKNMQSMSGQERNSYMQSMRNNLMQRLARYDEIRQRGFGGEMDEGAMMDYNAIRKSLEDINKMMTDPKFLEKIQYISSGAYESQRAGGNADYYRKVMSYRNV